jgi:hypothetical protein
MQHGTQRINVRPRTLFTFAFFTVLLNGRKTRFEHDFSFVGKIANLFTGGAKVEQHRQLIFLNLDVIQRDIPMQVARLMNGVDPSSPSIAFLSPTRALTG